MIRSFRCSETDKIFRREFSRKFPSDIQARAFMKLNAIDAAVQIQDLRLPASNRLEILKGDGKVNGVFALTISGGSVSNGSTVMRRMWRSRIIISGGLT